MANLVETVGLSPVLRDRGIDPDGVNFENLYSELHAAGTNDLLLEQLEEAVFRYFSTLELPDEPTLYDHMVLSLRPKDLIATFNWDPFLWLAMTRLAGRFGPETLPSVLFLHGNVSVGFCHKHEPASMGDIRAGYCKKCGQELIRSKLLYPVAKKDYQSDPAFRRTWNDLQRNLGECFIFTVFGYSAPVTDVEAVGLLKEAWGDANVRDQEQVEIIDIRHKDDLAASWDPFICREHYFIMNDFSYSLAAKYPRRSCEAFSEAIHMCDPQEEAPMPIHAGWGALGEWLTPLFKQEKAFQAKESDNVHPAR